MTDNKPTKQDEKPKKVLLKEDDLASDMSKELNSVINSNNSKPVGKLAKDLKASMVLNSIEEYKAILFKIHHKYNPMTQGAKPETLGGEEGTLFAKKPTEKLSGVKGDVEQLKGHGMAPISFGDAPAAYRQKSAIGDEQSIAKWQNLQKTDAIIAYERKNDGSFKLSDKGKLQLEFLQRMLSNRPLQKNGDPSVDIETDLLGEQLGYADLVRTNAEKIIRDFFTKAVVGILAATLKRNTNAPKDTQFARFVDIGVNQGIDATIAGKYDQNSFSNYGAWFIQVIKNKVVDVLRAETDYSLDTTEVYNYLSNTPGPLAIDSRLAPDEAMGSYNDVRESRYTFTKNGEVMPFFSYIYNNPEDALADLEAKAIKTAGGTKKSPLRAAYLREPEKFYKSTMRSLPSDYTQTQTTPEYFENYEDIDAATVNKIAGNQITNILQSIAKQMVTVIAKEGEEVKLSGRENASYPTLTKGKPYIVVNKGEDPVPGGGKPKKYYIITDDTNQQIKVSARALTPTKTVEGNVLSTVKENEDAVVETLRLLLQYGRFKPVYTKTVYLPKSGGWMTKNVGETAVVNNAGNPVLPFSEPKRSTQYRDSLSAGIEYVWSSEKYSTDVNDKMIDDLSKVAIAKGISLPKQFFDDNNQPLYKTKKDPEIKNKTIEFINGIRNKLRKYFGFTKLDSPVVKQNRDVLNKLITNYTLEHNTSTDDRMIAENIIRRQIQRILKENVLEPDVDNSHSTLEKSAKWLKDVCLRNEKMLGLDVLWFSYPYKQDGLDKNGLRKLREKFIEQIENKKRFSMNEISKDAQDYVSKKIAYLINKEGKNREQAAGQAYGMAREKGFKIPQK